MEIIIGDFPQSICVIKHAQSLNAKGYTYSSFRPLFGLCFFPNGIDPAEYVAEYLVLSSNEGLIVSSHLGINLFNGQPNTPV